VELLDHNGVVMAAQYFAGTAGSRQDFYFSVSGVKAVRVQLNEQNYLHMQEVEVMGVPEVNVALHKNTQQSSSWDPVWGSHKAVDGNISGEPRDYSYTHTAKGDTNRWWEVDLNGPHKVQMVRIWNRTDCCGDRLLDFNLELIGVDGQPLTIDPITSNKTINYNGTAGRQTDFWIDFEKIGKPVHQVRIKHPKGDFLQLAEVEVFGIPMLNVARGKPAMQSSIARTIRDEYDAIRVPALTMNEGFTLTADVEVARKNKQSIARKYFTLKGDMTHEVWCAQSGKGPIYCGVHQGKGLRIHARISSGGANNYYGQRFKLSLVVDKRQLTLYINGVTVGQTPLTRDFRFGHFTAIQFGNSQHQPGQGLNATFYDARIVAKAMTAEEISSDPLGGNLATYWAAAWEAEEAARLVNGVQSLDTVNIPAFIPAGSPSTTTRTLPWWKVDLGTSHCISSVRIWTNHQLPENFKLQLLTGDGYLIRQENISDPNMPTKGFTDIKVNECHVYQVRLSSTSAGLTSQSRVTIALDEVEVFGSPLSNNAASGGIASQASGANAHHAIDGILSGDPGKGDPITHTDNANQGNWWMLTWRLIEPRTISQP